MATVGDLKSVLKETLESRGVLGQIRARVRAEVFNALDEQSEERPPLSNENMIINELIREYLEFNRYRYTCSVLMSETGQPREALDRQFLANELNLSQDESSSSVPLLYGILSHFMSGRKRVYESRHSAALGQQRQTRMDQNEVETLQETEELNVARPGSLLVNGRTAP
ncbi:centrosomal protein 20-like [Corticium candelabrum]|uniref:centrosomal protein 20-like n=1 Tax=Corticium candelabrum TaxID=121492 RepID=UPI002E36703A|nr:centrosomal protein 20-like [Corticium candelabrum]